MPAKEQSFSRDKVKALRAYFEEGRRSARGKPEHNDLETTVKLCDQLIAAMDVAKTSDQSA